MQHIGQPLKAVALLEPLFTRGKQIFTANMTPILVSPSESPNRRERRACSLIVGWASLCICLHHSAPFLLPGYLRCC